MGVGRNEKHHFTQNKTYLFWLNSSQLINTLHGYILIVTELPRQGWALLDLHMWGLETLQICLKYLTENH